MRTAFHETLQFLVNLIEITKGIRVQRESLREDFRQFSYDIADYIEHWLIAKRISDAGPVAGPVAVYEVNVNSTRTNTPASMSIYFQEVFAKLHTHGSTLDGYSDSYTKCPALPLLLDLSQNSFVDFVKDIPKWSNLLTNTIQFDDSNNLGHYLTEMWTGFTSVPNSFTNPLCSLMNDHYMNLWSLQPSRINFAVLSTVTQENIKFHFLYYIHELINQHRTITYKSSTETSVIMCSNKYITKNNTPPPQGVTFNIGQLFADFVDPILNLINPALLRARSFKKRNALNLKGELQKIDPLLQKLNSLRLGQSTRNINEDRNNQNIRMNYNSNRTPAILFVETVFRLILSQQNGFKTNNDRLDFENDLRKIYSTFTVPRAVNAKELKINGTNVFSTNSNVTRAIKDRNNATMRNVNLTRIKKLVDYMNRNFQVIFKYSQSGNDSSIKSAHKGKFSLGNSILNVENEWDYISWFLSNVGPATGESNPILTHLRTTHKLIVSAVFALITKFHSQFVRALLQPITENTNNTSTRLHNLNAEQRMEAVSMCYSNAHSQLLTNLYRDESGLVTSEMNRQIRLIASDPSDSVSRKEVVERFMNRYVTSSAAAYLWYDCGDTHAMRSATQATLKLMLQLRKIGFLEKYPITGYTASTSPLFEQSVILKQTGVLCAPVFLEALRRQLSRLNEVTSYVSYNSRNGTKIMETRNTRVRNTTVNFNARTSANPFSEESIYAMGGIEYKKVSQSFIDSILKRSNNIPTNKIISNESDFALSLHQYFMNIYTSIPAYKNRNFRFYLVHNEYTEELTEVSLLKKLLTFDYWQLRRSFCVSHFINLKIINANHRVLIDTNTVPLVLEHHLLAKESLSLLERVLAYWQMYSHADRQTGITNRTKIQQILNAGILDDFGSSIRFHRGMYGSTVTALNTRLNMEYSMAVEKSKEMRKALRDKFS
jgi:hypothetical protein